ncbi:hypothetical protein KCU99_g31, partial [Aureobasidium melanogenum]
MSIRRISLRRTYSVRGAAASSWAQRAAFAYTFVQGVLVAILGGSWDVRVQILDQAGEWDGLGSGAVHDRAQVKHTLVPAVPWRRS